MDSFLDLCPGIGYFGAKRSTTITSAIGPQDSGSTETVQPHFQWTIDVAAVCLTAPAPPDVIVTVKNTRFGRDQLLLPNFFRNTWTAVESL